MLRATGLKYAAIIIMLLAFLNSGKIHAQALENEGKDLQDNNYAVFNNGYTIEDGPGVYYTGEQTSERNNSSVFVYSIKTFNTKCRYAEGGIAIKASGGIPPYRYAIDTTRTWGTGKTVFFSDLVAGVYKIFVRDAMNTLDSVSVTITNTLEPPTFYVPYLLYTRPGCGNTLDSLTIAASEGQPPYLYSTDILNYQTSPTFTDLHSGNYYWTVKDANGCVRSAHGDISGRFCDISLGLSYGVYFCGNIGTVDINASSGQPPYQYSIDNGSFQPQGVFTNLSPGQHKLIARDSTGLEVVYVFTTPGQCLLKATASATPATCGNNNGIVTVAATNGVPPYEYSIDGFIFQSSNLFSGLTPGYYPIIVIDSAGKTAYSSITVNSGCPSITATTIPTNCGLNNGSIRALGSNGKEPYAYSINGVDFQNSTLYAGLAAGNYTVSIKDSLGFKDSLVVIVPVGTCFTVSATPRNGICGQLGSITAAVINGVTPIRYSLNGINYQSSNIFTGLAAGNYVVYAKSYNEVIDSTTAVIVGTKFPKFSLGNDVIGCSNETYQLSPDSNYSNVNYLWNTGDTTRNIIAVAAGDYWLKITNTDGCIWKDTVSVKFKSLAGFSLGTDTSICENDSIILNATVAGASNYTWSNGLSTPQIKASQKDWYWCDVTKDGCVYRDSLYLTIKPLPVVNLGADTILCEETRLQLNAFNTGANYTWQDNSINSVYDVSKAGKYSVAVDKNGCIAKDTINITYLLKPNFSLGSDQLICQGQIIPLKPVVDASWNLLWQDGSTNPSFLVTEAGTYHLDATNQCGAATDEVSFTQGLCDIYIPTAFSPNGNTRNSIFKVSGTSLIKEFHLQVFNRYGLLVYETTDKNNGWDGLYKGTPSPAGAYVYLLQYKDNRLLQIKILKGSFLLLR